MYKWPAIQESPLKSKFAFVGVKTSLDSWHNRVGHPSKILNHLISKNLPILSNQHKSSVFCDSCLCSKSHKQPFGGSSLKIRKDLDLVYFDVWGPSPVKSMDGFSYYVLFVDHYTKYCWLYPMAKKIRWFLSFCTIQSYGEKIL